MDDARMDDVAALSTRVGELERRIDHLSRLLAFAATQLVVGLPEPEESPHDNS